VSGFRLYKKEPQNTEQGIMNVEGKENFIIRNSLFDIRYSNYVKTNAIVLAQISWDYCASVRAQF
jgi:hypothetical protein